MKHLTKAAVFTFLFFIGVNIVFAQDGENSTTELVPRKGLEINLEASHIKYQESDLMDEKGIMYGISGVYTFRPDKYMIKVDGRFSFGDVDYTSRDTGTVDDIRDYIVETRFTVGYDYNAAPTIVLTPYLGVGYRYLKDELGGKTTTTGALGYDRESNYFYSPVGLDALFKLEDGWSLDLIGEYDIFWFGKQISRLDEAVPGFNKVTNDQKSGYGLRGAVKIKKNMGNMDIIVEPFVRYWNIKKSDNSDVLYQGVVLGYGYEPKNESTEYGVKIGARF